MSYTIRTEYKGQGEDVVGLTFDTLNEAEQALMRHGWNRVAYNDCWAKDGPVRMFGQIGVTIEEYVFIEEGK